jgi:ribosomal protein S18 acetylase RimI-like enzyme
MKLNPSKQADLPAIMNIIGQAQAHLAAQGIDQWQDGYPGEDQIIQDINNQESFVIVDGSENVMATVVFATRPEITYQQIDGQWLTPSNATYGVIHRLAVGADYHKMGIAQFIIQDYEVRLKALLADSLRIDTHRQNKGMQHILKKIGYTYCGIIYLENGDERLAFEKLLDE